MMCVLMHLLICTVLRAHIIVVEHHIKYIIIINPYAGSLFFLLIIIIRVLSAYNGLFPQVHQFSHSPHGMFGTGFFFFFFFAKICSFLIN